MSGLAHITNGGRGEMMGTVGLKVPYPRVSQVYVNFSEGKVI